MSLLSWKDVYNAHETKCFFKCLPDGTDTLMDVDCRGGKQSKVWPMVLLAANEDGTETLTALLWWSDVHTKWILTVKLILCKHYKITVY